MRTRICLSIFKCKPVRMKPKIIFILLALALSFYGCEKIKLGKVFDCHIGTNYRINQELSFTINSLNDSRCPENMRCILPGTVYLNFNINLKGNIIDTVLYINPSGQPPDYQIGEYEFAIYKVEPISIGTTTSQGITIEMVITKF